MEAGKRKGKGMEAGLGVAGKLGMRTREEEEEKGRRRAERRAGRRRRRGFFLHFSSQSNFDEWRRLHGCYGSKDGERWQGEIFEMGKRQKDGGHVPWQLECY